jgi:uncharacterized protein (UPF0335 family)
MPRKSLKAEVIESIEAAVVKHNAENPSDPVTFERNAKIGIKRAAKELRKTIEDTGATMTINGEPVLSSNVVTAFAGRTDSRQAEAFTPAETGETIAAGQLKSIVERIERLEADKKEIAEDVKEVYGEAKANGFQTGIIRKVIALRKRTAAERAEESAILDLYLQALGMTE